jgi:riboflavin synthase
MFTGLVQDIGTIASVQPQGTGLRAGITTNLDLTKVAIGASIACSGVCLTVVSIEEKTFYVEVSGETLSVTSLKNWQTGTKVNLEPSLRLGDELGGHFVFGHVDAVAEVTAVTPDGTSKKIEISAPKNLSAFIAAKGSVSLDGVSLTVNEVVGNRFAVNIIPHTLEHTTLGERKAGDKLNMEVDMLARYVARMLGPAAQQEAA